MSGGRYFPVLEDMFSSSENVLYGEFKPCVLILVMRGFIGSSYRYLKVK